METPSFKISQDRDRISALPDELLLGILERLSLREAVRTGAVSTRWQHLPHQLSRVDLDVDDFEGTAPLGTMNAFTTALCGSLPVCPPAECKCDCRSRRAVKTISLHFYLSDAHMSSIGRAVEDTVSRGQTERLDFVVIPPSSDLIAAELGQQLMSFSRASPVAFRWLTGLSLTSLEFGDSDLPSLMGACDKLKHLSFGSCGIVGHSVLKIDAPNSLITKLEFFRFRCTRIELVSVPKLRRLLCYCWRLENLPLRFGYVPELHKVELAGQATTWSTPFALSACFSASTMNLSKLYLSFRYQMIWIQPEHRMQLTGTFSNLTDVWLSRIFPECDLNWTLFILEAAPALQNFKLNWARHSCAAMCKGSAEKTNIVWEPSKHLKHFNLKLLMMIGFEEEEKVTNYIRLVMERAVALKRIELRGNVPCSRCNAIGPESPRRSEVDEASRHQVRERLTDGSSSAVEIIIC